MLDRTPECAEGYARRQHTSNAWNVAVGSLFQLLEDCFKILCKSACFLLFHTLSHSLYFTFLTKYSQETLRYSTLSARRASTSFLQTGCVCNETHTSRSSAGKVVSAAALCLNCGMDARNTCIQSFRLGKALPSDLHQCGRVAC